MPITTRDLTRDWRAGDPERLARFYNKTGRGWPGGAWDPQTPAEAARRLREQNLLGAFVAVANGEFVAFCSVAAKPAEMNRAYVPFLTADPDFHGKGYGKAVLLRAVERVYERGIARVDLHTWPGNMKAVPLYKKSGFMWSPESGQWGVYMQNFTPGARRNAIAQEFFRKHDWYRTMKRDLALAPDEHKRGKVRVYEYIWEAHADRLRMVYDRQSWGLVEIETNDFLIGCYLADEKLVAGLPHQIKWRLVNHRKDPLDIVLMAVGEEGIKLDHKQVLQLKSRAELAADFEVDPDIKDKEKQPRVPILRTDLLINGKPVKLEAGFQVQQAVHFGLDGDGQGLRPDNTEPLILQCRSELDRPATVKLRLAASPGAELDKGAATVRLPAKGSAELPLHLIATDGGAVSLKVRSEVQVGRKTVRPKDAELHAHILSAGDVLGRVEKDRVVLESAALKVNIWRRGGWMGVVDKLRNRGDIASLSPPQVGPPYSWDEFFDTPCDARIEREPGRAIAVLVSPSINRPGVVLEQRVVLSNLPLVEVTSALLNGSGARLECSLRQFAHFNLRTGMIAAAPDGEIIRAPAGGAARSLGEHRLPEEGEKWTEGWIAAEHQDGVAAALLWRQAERVDWTQLTRKLPPASPGQSSSAEPIYLFVGDGDHFTVRRWWQTLFGPRADREQRRPEPRPPLEFGLRPRPTVLHGNETEVELRLDSVGRVELDGRLDLALPDGLRVRPSHLDFKRLSGARSPRVKVRLSRSASASEGAYRAECTARIDRAVYRERQPVIVLGDPRKPVTVEQTDDGGLFRIANGVLALTVAPGFMGAATSLTRAGEELLRSAYPEARPLAWFNPWLGGIQPHFGGMPSVELLKKRFRAKEIERRGGQGIGWRGVRVSCSPKEGPRREDRLELDYLLAPGSSIFAVAVRAVHRGGTTGWFEAGFDLWPIVGGSYLDALLSADADARTSRLRCEFSGEVSGERWAIAENPKEGESVVLACTSNEAAVGADVVGRDGYFLVARRWATHEARQTRESIFFIAYTETAKARDLAGALAQLKELP